MHKLHGQPLRHTSLPGLSRDKDFQFHSGPRPRLIQLQPHHPGYLSLIILFTPIYRLTASCQHLSQWCLVPPNRTARSRLCGKSYPSTRTRTPMHPLPPHVVPRTLRSQSSQAHMRMRQNMRARIYRVLISMRHRYIYHKYLLQLRVTATVMPKSQTTLILSHPLSAKRCLRTSS